jgi:hypothetical protein
MRKPSSGTVIGIFVIIMLIVGLRFIHWPDFAHQKEVERIANQESAYYLKMTIHYEKPPVYEEVWDIRDVNGVSTATYKITGYSGKVVTVTAPPDKNTNVSFFAERVVADGIWDLTSQPPRGDTSKTYTVYIKQIADFKTGIRTVIFTDPHYWATTAGRQFHIHLDKKKPTPNLVTLQSQALADPRYEKVVNEFLDFGTPSFKAKVAHARALVAASH